MKKTFFKKLFTASIAAITALSVFRGVPTFADDTSATTMATGENNAVVKINKTLNIAEGITTPTATFTFTFTEKEGTSSNGAPYQKGVNIPNRTVKYSKDDTQVNNKIVKATDNIFDGVTYNHAGEYVYVVKEEKSGWSALEKDGKKIDSMRYNTRTYDMHVIVKNKTSNGVYISSVYFKENKTSSAGKVEPSGTGVYDLFDNTYAKDASRDPNPENPDKINPTAKALTITKKVDGASGDKTKDFHFHIHIQLPNTNSTAESPLKMLVVQHGETFTIDQLPAGSHYTLTETGVPGYTASSVYLTNGTSTNGAAGQLGQDYKVENILLGEKTNNNTVTNKINDVTPTGLLIDNLPFILMIGLGLAGFVVLSKKRREA